jgi:phage shock protein A
MPYFSRLSDIISCSLSSLLHETDDRLETIQAIVGEVEQGVAGARRSVTAANLQLTRLEADLAANHTEIEAWGSRAKTALSAGNDDQARLALLRKRELTDLTAGLQQQLAAALKTRDHLQTVLRAIEARYAEAIRLRDEISAGRATPDILLANQPPATDPWHAVDRGKRDEIEAELAALKQQLS